MALLLCILFTLFISNTLSYPPQPQMNVKFLGAATLKDSFNQYNYHSNTYQAYVNINNNVQYRDDVNGKTYSLPQNYVHAGYHPYQPYQSYIPPQSPQAYIPPQPAQTFVPPQPQQWGGWSAQTPYPWPNPFYGNRQILPTEPPVVETQCRNFQNAPCVLLKYCSKIADILFKNDMEIVLYVLNRYQCDIDTSGHTRVCCSNDKELDCLRRPEPSTCTLVENCPSVKMQMENQMADPQSSCDFDGDQLYVCCPADRVGVWGGEEAEVIQVEEFQRETGKNLSDVLTQDQVPVPSGVILRLQNSQIKPGIELCGLQKKPHFMQTKIFGGNDEAGLKDFPWVAILRYTYGTRNDTYTYNANCSGALITSRDVVTSAACVSRLNDATRVTGVILGAFNQTTTHAQQCRGESCITPLEIPVQSVTPHPHYDGTINDIAIIRLSRPIDTDSYIVPICLPEADNINADGKKYVIGWWLPDQNGWPDGNLRKAEGNIVDMAECSTAYDRSTQPINQVCAEGATVNLCALNSGSLLTEIRRKMTSPPNGRINFRFTITGIASKPPLGCSSQSPLVFTDVSKYLTWIEDQISS